MLLLSIAVILIGGCFAWAAVDVIIGDDNKKNDNDKNDDKENKK